MASLSIVGIFDLRKLKKGGVVLNIKIFLMTKFSDSDWRVGAHQDLENLLKERAQVLRVDAGASSVVHVGFQHLSTERLEKFVTKPDGALILSAAARYALPESLAAVTECLGSTGGLDLYLAASEWAVDAVVEDVGEETSNGAEAEVEPTHPFDVAYRSKPDWLKELSYRDRLLASHAAKYGINDELTYQEYEQETPEVLREALGWARYLYYVNLLPDKDSIFFNLYFLPPWLLDLELEHVTLSTALDKALKGMGVTRIENLLTHESFGKEDFLRRNLADEMAERLLGLFLDGPWEEQTEESLAISAQRRRAAHFPPPTSENFQRKQVDRLSEEGDDHESWASLKDLFDNFASSLDDTRRHVLQMRMGIDGTRYTLEQVGQRFGRTREWARQTESSAAKKVKGKRVWKDGVTQRLQVALDGASEPVLVEHLGDSDPWLAHAAVYHHALSYVLKNFCDNCLFVIDVDGALAVSRISPDDWDAVKRKARETALKLVDDKLSEGCLREAIDALLPEAGRELGSALWSFIKSESCFSTTGNGLVFSGFGKGLGPVVRAVLAESDTPLHYEKVAELCSKRMGAPVSPRDTQRHLGEIGIQFASGTYGLRQHVRLNEDESQFIVGLAETVMAHGPEGRQWHSDEILEKVLESNSTLEGRVDSHVVSTVLSASGRIRSLGRMIWVLWFDETTDPPPRIDIQAAVREVLERAGREMTGQEIKETILTFRGVGKAFQILEKDGVVRASRGMWGLSAWASPSGDTLRE